MGLLQGMEVEGKVLILTHGVEHNLYLSARNLPGVEVRRFGGESTHDVLWARTIVIERSALDGGDSSIEAVEAESAEEGEADA